MNKAEVPLSRNLITPDITFSQLSIFHLYDEVATSQTKDPETPNIVAYLGPPLSGKSHLVKEGIHLLSHDYVIRQWQKQTGTKLQIKKSAYENGLPPKEDRTNSEAEHYQASYDLGTDIIQNLSWLQTHPGILTIEAPGILGLTQVEIAGRIEHVPVGYERGNTPLFYLARRLNGPGSLQYLQDLKYRLSVVIIKSDDEVKKEALMDRRYKKDDSEDAQVIMEVLKQNRTYRDPEVENAGGASVDNAILENRRLEALIIMLGRSMHAFELPEDGDPDYSLKAHTAYAEYFLRKYLKVPRPRAYFGENRRLSSSAVDLLAG